MLGLQNLNNLQTIVQNKKGKYLVTDTYQGHEEGVVVTSLIHPLKKKGYLPRFGKCYHLSSTFDDVKYIGRSGESYVDMKDQFIVKENVKKVIEMTEPNIRPQESGNRTDVTSASIISPHHKISFIALNSPFELSVKPYSDRSLIKMKHIGDEIRSGTYVTIEAFQQGIGTGACGPVTADKYKYPNDRDYILKFLIKVL